MTTITIDRATVEQALEALKDDQYRQVATAEGHWEYKTDLAIAALEAALAQQAEPVEPVALKHRHEWFRTGGMEPGQFRCIHCGVWGQEQADPQVEDRLARHGIPMPGDPK